MSAVLIHLFLEEKDVTVTPHRRDGLVLLEVNAGGRTIELHLALEPKAARALGLKLNAAGVELDPS